jgi:hypothetical protein
MRGLQPASWRTSPQVGPQPFRAEEDGGEVAEGDGRVYDRDRPPIEFEGFPRAGAAFANQAGWGEVAQVRVLPEPSFRLVADAAELVLGVGAALVTDTNVTGAADLTESLLGHERPREITSQSLEREG